MLVTTPTGYTYSYVATAVDPLATIVDADFSGATVVGVGFFIDLAAGLEG